MDARLNDVINGKEGNYLMPFLWLHAGEHDKIARQIAAISESGVRAFCVESRPHERFGQDEWWRDMDLVLAEATRLGMRVWILDDKHYPTGYCNGLIASKYPNRRKWHLVEDHVDVMGPMREAMLIASPQAGWIDPSEGSGDTLVGVFAYRRMPHCEEIQGPALDLSGCVRDGFLTWDVPEGVWRVFFLYKTRRGATGRSAQSMHMIDRESVSTLIEAVYEPHYRHYEQYFGNTIAGFFSDEPSFGNELVNWQGARGTMYDNNIGTRGLALPWSEELLERMNAELGADARPLLPALWHTVEGGCPDVRVAYMNAVTGLWREHFSFQIGDWCRAHGVEYIGHIIEDMNAHAHLGCSGGHFFRSLDGQDMSGIDIVLHQWMPGFADHPHAASCAGGVMDTEFFHYVLAKLASSHARMNPRMKGRAMCEVFGAYGWAEDTALMKAMMDHLFVRGVNHFVPHAFSMTFPDPDCPPQFFADGHNPQFGAFSALMRYSNKMSHLLSGGARVVNAALLYHAEAEWSGTPCMRVQRPAKALYDRQIDFEIVSMDHLLEASRMEPSGKLAIADARFDCLIIPGATYLPSALLDKLAALHREGLALWFIETRPDGFGRGEIVALDALAERMALCGFTDVTLEAPRPMLRALHLIRDGSHVFFFNNESGTERAAVNARLPVAGTYTRLDLQLDQIASGEAPDGIVKLDLEPYQSTAFVFCEASSGAPALIPADKRVPLPLRYAVSAASYEDLSAFKELGEFAEGVNMTGFGGPLGQRFSGMLRYEAVFDAPEGTVALDLGSVGSCARIELNGNDLGWRMCGPFRYDIQSHVRAKGNRLTIWVSNTLANALRDPFSHFVPIRPAGLLGPVSLLLTIE